MVVPEFQGRGIAVAATAQAIELAKRDDKHHYIHAFPNVDNGPSNAICRKLGFELLEACEFEFPSPEEALQKAIKWPSWRISFGAQFLVRGFAPVGPA